MKQIIYLLIFIISTGCGRTNSDLNSNNDLNSLTDQVSDKALSEINNTNQNLIEENQKEEYRKQPLSGFKKVILYKLTDSISADFNGDGVLDQAFYKKEKLNC
jgi:Tfp pilus assembly protein PilP